jgi:Cu+-exporting ATPase
MSDRRVYFTQLQVHLLTGDNWATARSIAERIGVPHVLAEVRPEGKARVIKELRAAHRTVAMVGDGINDAPALVAAGLAIAIGSGTQVAIEAADFVLVRSDLEDVLVALDLARHVFWRIRWNYVWAMGYNVAMVPIAAGVFFPATHVQLPPMLAGLTMSMSSVSVVLSSLLLNWYRRPKPVARVGESLSYS